MYAVLNDPIYVKKYEIDLRREFPRIPVLDQYKESTPKDPTIREKFNTYRFADYKEKVIDLLGRVAAVSVETQRIVEEMKKAPR